MDMIEAILFIASLLGVYVLGYYVGKRDGKHLLEQAKATLVTERAVRHNLNCLVGDLRFAVEQKCLCILSLREDVQKNKADALAFNSLKGQWVTDKKHLIAYNSRPEGFRCIGYPERRL